jgi:glucosylceramidase
VSGDGVHWTTVVADGVGTGQLTTIALDGKQVRYVRVTLTASSGSWWSIADIRAYEAGRT